MRPFVQSGDRLTISAKKAPLQVGDVIWARRGEMTSFIGSTLSGAMVLLSSAAMHFHKQMVGFQRMRI